MQIILLEKVAKLGNLGDVVKVKDGYARNFLIPGKLARRATEAAIKEFEDAPRRPRKGRRRQAGRRAGAGRAARRQDRAHRQKAGVDGRLFGSVTNADIAEGLTKIGFAVAEVAGAHAQWSAEGAASTRCRCRRTPTWSSTSPCRWSAKSTERLLRLRTQGRLRPAFFIPGTALV